jgi:hypothetical protein
MIIFLFCDYRRLGVLQAVVNFGLLDEKTGMPRFAGNGRNREVIARVINSLDTKDTSQ